MFFIRKVPDVGIWNVLFDLITTSRLTHSSAVPPFTIPLSFDSTPITHSLASQQGGEQTREVVEGKDPTDRMNSFILRCFYVQNTTDIHFHW